MATLPRPMPGPGGPGGAPGGPPGLPGAPPGPGGAGPMGGPMMQQALGQLAGNMPGGDPTAALRSLQATPAPDNVELAIRRAQEAANFAMAQVGGRSPEVAKELASALMNLKQAQQKLQAMPRQEAPRPPQGLPMAGGMMGGPAPGPAPIPPPAD